MKQIDEYDDPELGVTVHVVEQADTSAQRRALRERAYSAEGKNDGFISCKSQNDIGENQIAQWVASSFR